MAPKTTGWNLVQVITSMRNFGIGVNVRRSVWKNPGCYWTVTRVKLNHNQPYKYGKVWGIYHWNYNQIGKETKIGGVAKKQWLVDLEQSPEMTPDLLRTMIPPKEKKVVDEELALATE